MEESIKQEFDLVELPITELPSDLEVVRKAYFEGDTGFDNHKPLMSSPCSFPSLFLSKAEPTADEDLCKKVDFDVVPDFHCEKKPRVPLLTPTCTVTQPPPVKEDFEPGEVQPVLPSTCLVLDENEKHCFQPIKVEMKPNLSIFLPPHTDSQPSRELSIKVESQTDHYLISESRSDFTRQTSIDEDEQIPSTTDNVHNLQRSKQLGLRNCSQKDRGTSSSESYPEWNKAVVVLKRLSDEEIMRWVYDTNTLSFRHSRRGDNDNETSKGIDILQFSGTPSDKNVGQLYTLQSPMASEDPLDAGLVSSNKTVRHLGDPPQPQASRRSTPKPSVVKLQRKHTRFPTGLYRIIRLNSDNEYYLSDDKRYLTSPQSDSGSSGGSDLDDTCVQVDEVYPVSPTTTEIIKADDCLKANMAPTVGLVGKGMNREHLKRRVKPATFRNFSESDRSDNEENGSEAKDITDGSDYTSGSDSEKWSESSGSLSSKRKIIPEQNKHSIEKSGKLCADMEDQQLSPVEAASLLKKAQCYFQKVYQERHSNSAHCNPLNKRSKRKNAPRQRLTLAERENSFFQKLRELPQKSTGGGFDNKYLTVYSATCVLCVSEFQNIDEISKHMAVAHGTSLYTPYRCEYCSSLHACLKELGEHILDKHKGMIRCVLCRSSFQDLNGLQNHVCKIEELGYSCATCGECFPSELLTRQHVAANRHAANHACDKCSVIAKSADYLKLHKKESHANDQTKFKCTLCDFGCMLAANMLKHYFTHPGVDRLKCMYCGRRYEKVRGVQNHLLRLHGKQGYICPVCNKPHGNKSSLEEHMERHAGKKHACEYCGRKFTLERYLRGHILRNHKGVKGDYMCAVCGVFRSCKSLLQMHMSTHAEKAFECSECGKKFNSERNLKNHQDNIHTDSPDIKRFLCDFCGRRFLKKHFLETHRISHTNENGYVCDICGKAFKRPNNLDSHRRTHTEDRPFVCDICGDGFKWKHNMENHRKIHKMKTEDS